MSDGTDLIYLYDGTFEGLLCCVFESYYSRKIPSEIVSAQSEQCTLFSVVNVETDSEKADRVSRSVRDKICEDALELIKLSFLTCHPQKEILILRFLYMGFRYGNKVLKMLSDDTIYELNKAVNHLKRESHRYKQFIRFSEYNNVMTAQIEPLNIVLPMISAHFSDRFRRESFMIYDKTHGMALIHYDFKTEIIPVDNLTMPAADENEKMYRNLWKSFYDTIGIEERYNPKCRMTLMPKRYWKYMTEFADLYAAENAVIEDRYNAAIEDSYQN